MKKQFFLVSLLSALLLTGCGANAPKSEGPGGNSEAPVEEPEIIIPEEIPEEQPENDFHTELQWSYIADPDWTNVKAYVPTTNAERSGSGIEQSKPLPTKFELDVDDDDQYFFEIDETKDFASPRKFQVSEKEVDVYNLEIGRKYYYRAAVSEESLAEAEVKEYRVYGAAPRNLNVDGVINFRDIGGWKSDLVEGGYINQGLYYRCAQFNSITAAGKEEIKRLGIKVDIDMRDRPPATSPATADDWEVEILDAHIASGTEPTRWEGFADTYKAIFEAMAEADEKPIALHCTHGADRTGIASFFLGGLLGMSVEDLGKDYMFTRYAGERAVWHEDEFDNWVSKTQALEGDTFADKMFNHLLSKGIEEDTLYTIREKFVPGYERP